MYIRRLTLTNYRAFEHHSLDLDRQLTVIAGINGLGKSSILEAIVTGVSHLQQREKKSSSGKQLSPTDVSVGRNNTTIEAEFVFPKENQILTAARAFILEEDLNKTNQNIVSLKAKLRSKDLRGEEKKKLQSELDRAQHIITDNRTRARTVAVKTDPSAQLRSNSKLPFGIVFYPDRSQFVKIKQGSTSATLGVNSALYTAMEHRPIRLTPLMHWYRQRMKLGARKDPQARVIRAMNSAVERFLEGFKNLKLEEKPVITFTIEKNGQVLDLFQLSDGERGMLALILDLSRRLSLAYPELDNPLEEGEAIVLIDEVELHLHPLWQRTVLENLRTTFPRVQFICTTHSPFIVQSLRAEELILLDSGMEAIPVTANRDLETITEGLMIPPPEAPIDDTAKLMGVKEPETSERYGQMKDDADLILRILERARQTTDRAELDKLRVEVANAMTEVQQKYADDPAYQAFLELKRTVAFRD